LLGLVLSLRASAEHGDMRQPVFYRTIKVDGLSIFYRRRAAGCARAAAVHDYLVFADVRAVISRLSDQFHLVAPDYPASGTATGLTRRISLHFDRIAG